MTNKILLILCLSLLIAGCANEPEYNLVVQLSIDPSNQAREYIVQSASLSCQEIPQNNSEIGESGPSKIPVSPKSWCNVKALNIPVKTKDRKVDLLFFVDPSPNSSNILFEDDPFSYDTPMINLQINGEIGAAFTENIENDIWRASVSQY